MWYYIFSGLGFSVLLLFVVGTAIFYAVKDTFKDDDIL